MLPQLVVNGIVVGSIYALVAAGLGLVYFVTKFFHFAHAIVFAAGAYCAYVFCSCLGLPILPSVVLAVIASAGGGGMIELAIYRPLRRKGASSLMLLLASLGLYVVLQNILSLAFGDNARTIRPSGFAESVCVLGARMTPIQCVIVILVFVVIATLATLLKTTRIGRAVRAVQSDSELARVSGVDSEALVLLVFVVASALGGLAGILASLDVDMTPGMGMSVVMMAIVSVVIAGKGSLLGIWLGSLLVGLAQHLAVWKIDAKWQDCLAFVILLSFLLFRPQGFFGKAVKKATV